MKVVIQRVKNASVTVDNQVISEIGRGLCVLIGISSKDTIKDIEYITRKILNTKFFTENDKRWAKSVKEMNLEILCISQFTLYYKFKGNKLDFHHAMAGEMAKEFYEKTLKSLSDNYDPNKIKDGKFAAMMDVNLTNDGPVTIEIESNKNEDDGNKKE
jgi:D-tyrosyl-tRNA(Tyr) deacylase